MIMKKTLRFLFTLLLVAVGTVGFAQTTVTFTAGTDKGSQTNAGVAGDKVTKDGITIETTSGNSAFGITGSNANYRFAKSSVTTFSSTVGNITSVVFNCTASGTTKYGPGCFASPNVGSYTTNGKVGTWTGDAASFTLTASSNQVRATSIVVTYTPSGSTTTVGTPSITGTTPFEESTTVTITATNAASIYYTTDGNDPDDRAGTEYTAPFTLTESATVKAIAYDSEGSGSSIASKEFVKTDPNVKGGQNNPYTPSELAALSSTEYSAITDSIYVKGIVSRNYSFNSNYGSMRYYISDDGTTTNEYYIFNGLSFNKAKFSAQTDVVVGATVVVKGVPTTYSGTRELGQNNYLIEYTAPTFTAPTITGTLAFTESTTVTIAAENATSIRYTLDGTDPTATTGTEYTAEFTLDATTTVKAIAVYTGGVSTVTTAVFTKITNSGTEDNPYTVGEAIALVNNGTAPTDSVYVKGIVASRQNFNSNYKNRNIWISDNGIYENTLEAYQCYNIGNTSFTADLQIENGDVIIVKGVLTKYNSTIEFKKGCYIVKLETPIAIGETGYATAYYGVKNLTIPEGVTATTYKVADGTNTLAGTAHAAGEVIPAGEAVVLSGEAGTYNFNVVTTTETTADADNELKGTDAETALTADATKYFYELSLNANKEAGSVGFYWANDDGIAFTNGAHKAYLTRTKDTTAAKISAYLLNGGTVTGINDINAEEKAYDGAIYNVAGQRVNKDYKGVVIINGKKIIKK